MLGYPQEKKTLSGKGEVHQANGSDQENGSMLHIPQRDAGITVKQPSITDSGPHKSNGKFEKVSHLPFQGWPQARKHSLFF